MNDEERSFTVTDRRHFTVEGQPRPEPETAEPDRQPGPEPAHPAAAPPHDEADPSVTFSAFLASLAAQASLLLHGMPEGEGHEAMEPDLQGARHVIAVLEMLNDKTEGRRTPAEDRLVSAILFDLRMAYVSAQSGGGGAS